MARVLIAQSVDWISTARLPAMLARAGVTCDLVDGGTSYASASSHIRGRTVMPRKVDDIAREVLRVAEDYDRVIVCNEALIRAVVRLGGPDASRVFGHDLDGLSALCDKTLFSPAARNAGLRVSDFEVVESAPEAAAAAERMGGRVVVKGHWGEAGCAIRIVDSPKAAQAAAAKLGAPALVERFVDGELVNTPCLYEKGKLVAAMASRKLETSGSSGPSTVNEFLVIDERLRSVCERMGAAFGISGFASADMFFVDDGDPVILEINPRQVPQLHLGKSVGVDMARAFADVLAGRWDGTPRLANRQRTVRLFPQSLIRSRGLKGPGPGTREWLMSSGAFVDVPWEDFGLLRRQFRDFVPVKR